MTKKFRVWDIQDKSFFSKEYLKEFKVSVSWDGQTIRQDFWGGTKTIGEDVIVQQWTGLTDSQGVEIYEGDIVDNLCRVDCAQFGGKIIEGCIPSHFSIEKSVFKEVKSVKDRSFDNICIIGYYKLKTTVIGNIFQTPELLEKCSK